MSSWVRTDRQEVGLKSHAITADGSVPLGLLGHGNSNLMVTVGIGKL